MISMKIPMANPNIGEEEARAVYEVVKSGWLNEGKKVEEFETNFAEYIGTKHAVAFFNGTVALHAVLHALGIKNGDEVIVPSFTFISTANSVLFTGAKPVFADIDENTFNISPEDIANKITNKTKAIIPVHYAGQSADMKELMELAEDHNLYLIEDAAEAHGAEYANKKVGSFGTAAMFSFTPTKNITTGEGGMITTNDSDLAKNLRIIKNHGQIEQYNHVVLGYNYRMTEMQGAIGIEQLKKLPDIILKKQHNQQYLTNKLSQIKGIIPPYVSPNCNHVYMIYSIMIDEELIEIERDQLIVKLHENGISSKIYFPPAHTQTLYKNLGYEVSLPITEKVYRKILSLPCYSKLNINELDYMIKTIKEII